MILLLNTEINQYFSFFLWFFWLVFVSFCLGKILSEKLHLFKSNIYLTFTMGFISYFFLLLLVLNITSLFTNNYDIQKWICFSFDVLMIIVIFYFSKSWTIPKERFLIKTNYLKFGINFLIIGTGIILMFVYQQSFSWFNQVVTNDFSTSNTFVNSLLENRAYYKYWNLLFLNVFTQDFAFNFIIPFLVYFDLYILVIGITKYFAPINKNEYIYSVLNLCLITIFTFLNGMLSINKGDAFLLILICFNVMLILNSLLSKVKDPYSSTFQSLTSLFLMFFVAWGFIYFIIINSILVVLMIIKKTNKQSNAIYTISLFFEITFITGIIVFYINFSAFIVVITLLCFSMFVLWILMFDNKNKKAKITNKIEENR